MTIRPEEPGDRQAIYGVVRDAFGRDEEARLVDALRESAAFVPGLSLVAVEGEDVVGHVLFTRLTVTDGHQGRPAVALAPLAVSPTWQNHGIGSALVRRGLADARDLGHQVVIVLGHPAYYPHWDRLLFRDYLVANAEVAREYEALKVRLASASKSNRVAYTRGKTEFIERVMEQARRRL